MGCANKKCGQADKLPFQLPHIPTAVYGLATELVNSCYNLVLAGLNTLPTNYTAADLLVILQALMRENTELQDTLKRNRPIVRLQNCAVHFEFGPDNAYTLDMNVPPEHAQDFAEQLADAAAKLSRRAVVRQLATDRQQLRLPFSDCA